LLSFSSDISADTWGDVRIAQKEVRLDPNLESCDSTQNIASIITNDGASQSPPNRFLSLYMISERARRWSTHDKRFATMVKSPMALDQGRDSSLEIINDSQG